MSGASLHKQQRESQRVERRLAARRDRDRERDDGRGVGVLPEGTGWTGTDDLAWSPLRPAGHHQPDEGGRAR